MAKISQEKDLEMLKKNADGSFTKYNPKTKAINVTCANGQSVETQLADNTNKISTAQSKANSAYSKAEQAFQSASNGKKLLASAITGKGVSASSNDTFSILANKIRQISTGKKMATGYKDVCALGHDDAYKLEINDLDFKPSRIYILFFRGGGDSSSDYNCIDLWIYSPSMFNKKVITPKLNTYKDTLDDEEEGYLNFQAIETCGVGSTYKIEIYSEFNAKSRGYRVNLVNNIIVTSNGFYLKNNSFCNTNAEYYEEVGDIRWIAIE